MHGKKLNLGNITVKHSNQLIKNEVTLAIFIKTFQTILNNKLKTKTQILFSTLDKYENNKNYILVAQNK